MDAIIAQLFEKSVVYGAFALLLHYVLYRQDKQLERFGKALDESNKTQTEIVKTLVELKDDVKKLKEES